MQPKVKRKTGRNEAIKNERQVFPFLGQFLACLLSKSVSFASDGHHGGSMDAASELTQIVVQGPEGKLRRKTKRARKNEKEEESEEMSEGG